jgi:hypothetical protein
MLRAAREFYLEQEFQCDSLPDVPTVPDQAFANVLCSGVLMHLPREHLPPAALTLARILRPGGRLVLPVSALWAHSPGGGLGVPGCHLMLSPCFSLEAQVGARNAAR